MQIKLRNSLKKQTLKILNSLEGNMDKNRAINVLAALIKTSKLTEEEREMCYQSLNLLATPHSPEQVKPESVLEVSSKKAK